ncbi:MAG TPA: SDR family oxidoreductase [bacterium]|nr:SDR family oxidoreductase [bacterium]
MALRGKWALVTGSGRNIGAAVADALAREGVNVVVNVRAARAEGEAVVNALTGRGVDACLVVADVSNPDQVRALGREVLERTGGIDILVNNVGIAPMHRLRETTDEQWDLILRTSLFSAFYCVRELVDAMVGRRWGRIVNVGGQAGLRGTKYKSANAAAKGGLVGFTRAVANEFAEFGITCNHVAPGLLERSHERPYYDDETGALDPEFRRRWLDRVPAGRPGSAEEVAAVCAFLCSEAAGYVTGQTILVNGGMMFV